uniref:Thiamine pyrophosphate carrier-like n=2 Tax=Hirondellea gigas TaxID=1518452 RepID=A0A6A7FTH4_9CRUS
MSSNVGYNSSSAQLLSTEIAAAGAFSGFVTRMVAQPLDVLKIRFQLQVESTSRRSNSSNGRGRYYGLLQAGRTIVQEEGVRALWRGHVAGQVLTVLFGAGQFWSYNALTRICRERSGLHTQQKQNNCKDGADDSTVSATAFNETDVQRTLATAATTTLSSTNSISSNNSTSCRDNSTNSSSTHRTNSSSNNSNMSSSSNMISSRNMSSSNSSRGNDNHSSNMTSSTSSGTGDISPLMLSACGFASGVCGTLMSMPCDVARTRIVAQSVKKYSGLLDVWRQMLQQEGGRSLWRGLMPTLASSAPFAAIQFPIYSFLMTATQTWSTDGGIIWRSSVSGGVAGLVAKLLVYPFDVLKKRSQIRGAEHLRRNFGKVVLYKSTWDIAVRVTKDEGLTGWFKGLSPALVKSVVVSGLLFLTYELTCQAMISMHHRDEGH